jgi:putative phage-type endonuclease
MKQGTPEWKAARLGKVTGSRFADVMIQGRGGGLSGTAESYLMELLGETLTGKPADDIKAKQIEWGNKHEPEARSWYVWTTECVLEEVGFMDHPEFPGIGVSPDALVGADGLLEIKCPFTTRTHINTLLSQEVPKQYEAQVFGGLWVTGRKWCDFVSYDPRMIDERLRKVCIRVWRDEDYISHIEDVVTSFRSRLDRQLERVKEIASQMRSES